MVTFNPQARNFTVTVPGNAEDYVNYLRALAGIIAMHDEQLYNRDIIYTVSSLLECMLPHEEQHVKMQVK